MRAWIEKDASKQLFYYFIHSYKLGNIFSHMRAKNDPIRFGL